MSRFWGFLVVLMFEIFIDIKMGLHPETGGGPHSVASRQGLVARTEETYWALRV